MNFVFLSPHFPSHHYLFCQRLQALGVRVLGIGDTPYEQLRPALRSALSEYYRVGDLHNHRALVAALQHFQKRWGMLDRIESHIEYWLETQAQLRTEFEIPGVKSDTILDVKQKSRMKQIFRQAGIPVARGAVVHTPEQARDLIEQTGYPVVAKPDKGVGAAATYKICDERELEAFFESKPGADYIMEEFIHGEICTFDGLVDREGGIVFCSALAYSQGIMETVNEDRHVYYTTLRELPADLEALGRRTVQAFGVRESFFHFEYFRTATGLVALEVNMRPPGGPTLDMWNWSSDIDLYREWARVVVHGRSPLAYSRKYFCCYVGRKLRNRYVHSHDEILARFGPQIVQHLRLEPVFARAMGDVAYILRAPSLDEVLEAADFIQKT